MWRKNILFCAVVSTFLVLTVPFSVSANTVFEASTGDSSRTSLDLYGGYVHALEAGPDSAVYVGFNSPNGFFFSTDGATTWNGLPEGEDFGNIANIEVSASSIFVIGGINVYRSQDSGASFQALSPQDVGSALHYGQGKIFVGMRDGTISVSSDEGDTFSNITIDSSITSITNINTATTSSDVYVLAQTGGSTVALFKSADGGTTWANTGITATTNAQATEITVKPTDANFLVLSGSTLTYTTTGVSGTWSTLTDSNFGSVVFSGDRIYVGHNYTDDNGATWTSLADTTNGGRNLKNESFVIDPNNSTIFYTETMQGVARSSDSGATWQDSNEGLSGITINDVAQSTADPDIVWLAAYSGLAKTANFTDPNPTWEFPVTTSGNVDFSTAVWLDPDDANYVVATMLNILYYSTDGGVTWTEATADLGGETVSDFFENNDVLYAAYGDGVAQSTDNGATWSSAGLTGMKVNTLAADSNNLYAGVGDENDSTAANRGIYKYDGTDWTQLSGAIKGYLVNNLLVVDGVIYVASGETSQGAVFKSDDEGETWTDLTDNGLASDGWYHALAVDPNDNNILYVSTARPAGTGSVYKTSDAGETWNSFYTGLKDETFNTMIFSATTAAATADRWALATRKNRGLVSGTNTGIYLMQSKASLKLTAGKKHVQKGNEVRLTVKLKDHATALALAHKKVRLYKKAKRTGNWHYVGWLKTNNKGKAVFTVKPQKSMYYQARWKAKSSADRSSYGYSATKSTKVRVRVAQ